MPNYRLTFVQSNNAAEPVSTFVIVAERASAAAQTRHAFHRSYARRVLDTNAVQTVWRSSVHVCTEVMSLARAASLYQAIHALLPDCIRCAFTRAHSQQELTDLLAAGSVPTAWSDGEFVLYAIQRHPRSVFIRLVRSEAARQALSMREERALAREVRR